MSRVLSFLTSSVWLLERTTFERMVRIVARHASGARLDAEQLDEVRQLRDRRANTRPTKRPYELHGDVAVLPVRGVISRYAGGVDDISAPRGVSTEELERNLQRALDDEEVGSILLDVDSPGGSASGVMELGDAIYSARGQKPIVALADGMAASAAYWLASQTDRIYTTRGSELGSIGVVATAIDDHRWLESKGFDEFVVTSTNHKREVTERNSVGGKALAAWQEMVDEMHGHFVDAVARGRGVDLEAAARLADGRMHLGERAIALGLADEVGTFREVVGELQAEHTRVAGWHEQRTKMADTNERTEATTHPASPPATPAPSAAAAAAAPTVNVEQIRQQAVADERARATGIRAAALQGQQQLAEQLIAEGVTVDQARVRFLDDARTRDQARLAELRTSFGAAVGQDEPAAVREVVEIHGTGAAAMAACEKRWDSDPEFRQAWRNNKGACLAYHRNGHRVGGVSHRKVDD